MDPKTSHHKSSPVLPMSREWEHERANTAQKRGSPSQSHEEKGRGAPLSLLFRYQFSKCDGR